MTDWAGRGLTRGPPGFFSDLKVGLILASFRGGGMRRASVGKYSG